MYSNEMMHLSTFIVFEIGVGKQLLGKIVMHLLCNLESLHLHSAGEWHNGAVGSVAASVLRGFPDRFWAGDLHVLCPVAFLPHARLV